jgi:hypothetical protein
VGEFFREVLKPAVSLLHHAGHHCPELTEAAKLACRIGDRPRGHGKRHRALEADGDRHPHRGRDPDKSAAAADMPGRDQDLDRPHLPHLNPVVS